VHAAYFWEKETPAGAAEAARPLLIACGGGGRGEKTASTCSSSSIGLPDHSQFNAPVRDMWFVLQLLLLLLLLLLLQEQLEIKTAAINAAGAA